MKNLRNWLGLERGLMLAASAAALAGCVGAPPPVDYSAYDGLENAGAVRRYIPGRVAMITPPAEHARDGQLIPLSTFEGLAGARLAAATFDADVAEQLDGRCEAVVRVKEGDTITRIADLCDVDAATLVAFNPQIRNPYLLNDGELVEVPGGVSAMAADLAAIYIVGNETSIEQVAQRFNVATSAIANLNPKADFYDLKTGDAIRMPAPGMAGGAALASAPPPQAAWQGYAGIAAGGAGAPTSGGVYDVSSQMPYRLSPTAVSLSTGSDYIARPALEVSERVIRDGRAVVVTARVDPYEEVRFTRGPNLGDQSAPQTVRADAEGRATVRYVIPKRQSDMGGVIVEAVREKGDVAYSQRVGVVKLGSDSADAAVDETE